MFLRKPDRAGSAPHRHASCLALMDGAGQPAKADPRGDGAAAVKLRFVL